MCLTSYYRAPRALTRPEGQKPRAAHASTGRPPTFPCRRNLVRQALRQGNRQAPFELARAARANTPGGGQTVRLHPIPRTGPCQGQSVQHPRPLRCVHRFWQVHFWTIRVSRPGKSWQLSRGVSAGGGAPHEVRKTLSPGGEKAGKSGDFERRASFSPPAAQAALPAVSLRSVESRAWFKAVLRGRLAGLPRCACCARAGRPVAPRCAHRRNEQTAAGQGVGRCRASRCAKCRSRCGGGGGKLRNETNPTPPSPILLLRARPAPRAARPPVDTRPVSARQFQWSSRLRALAGV